MNGLGGKLLYAGDLAGDGRKLLFAANIAGAASLAASADPLVQRHSIRDGVVDFVVTSLEEALRILKNEIRKRQTVSVGVAISPDRLVEQMLERGVLPDLLPPAELTPGDGLTAEQASRFQTQGAVRVGSVPELAGRFTAWSVDRNYSRWLPRIDQCVKGMLTANDKLRERWLHLSPRYLGRLAQQRHGVELSSADVERLRIDVRQMLTQHAGDDGGLPVVEIDGQPVFPS